MGGEPLLHPDAIEFLKHTRKVFPNSYIELVTNGLIFVQNPQSNEFIDNLIEAINEFDIIVDISIYPPIKSFPEYITRIKKLRGEPRSFFTNISLDLSGKQDINYAFENCANQAVVDNSIQQQLNIDSKVRCVFLKDGFIYPCAIVACINYFENHFDKKLVDNIDNNRINIFENNIEQIDDFLSKPIPFCKYCRPNMQKTSQVLWEQSKKDISEWTSTIKIIEKEE